MNTKAQLLARNEAVAQADAFSSKAGLPSYSELLASLRTYDNAIWDDCRIPGDVRKAVECVHHTVLGHALRDLGHI